MSIRTRWTARLNTRRSLLRSARARFAKRKTKANLATVKLRKEQVAQAERVIARHPDAVTSISPSGTQFIAEFEGCVLHAYWDATGRVWTIGYGHTENVKQGDTLPSKAAALALLKRDLDKKYAPFVARLGLPLNQHQFDALVSFVYNLGPGVLERGHTMGDALARHDWGAAADAFLLYDKSGGQRLVGLTRRRAAERAVFMRDASA